MTLLLPALTVPATGNLAGGATIVGVRAVLSQPDSQVAGAAVDFDRFYRQEYHAVVALAYALTGRPAVAEELAQDAFLVAHRSWARVSHYEVPAAFVRRVVTNMSVSFTRRLAVEARAIARLGARPSAWAAPLPVPDADFWRSVRSLPRRQAQVLALRYLEDRSDHEIAHILGCSEATVRVHLHNGRSALATRLGIEPTRSPEDD
jgi:DNA-directed RNA polymerase specialized sigma24 family protein